MPSKRSCANGGWLSADDGETSLTPAGRAMADQILSARRDELHAMLADHETQRRTEVQQLLERFCVELSGQRP